MRFIKVKTRPILPPKDNIYKIFERHLPKLRNGDVLVITSKILAIHQGRCVKISPQIDKDQLVLEEAEKFIPRARVPRQLVILTIKEHTLIPTSGIDESNGDGYYVLWPKHASKAAKEICKRLKKKFKLKQLAVIVTDSHTIPMRRGTVGISTGFYGIEPLYDYRGKKDIFGRELKMTQANVVDSLANTAVLLMGEGSEQTPMLIIRNAEFVKFTNKNSYRKLVIPEGDDLYTPLLEAFEKKNNSKKN